MIPIYNQMAVRPSPKPTEIKPGWSLDGSVLSKWRLDTIRTVNMRISVIQMNSRPDKAANLEMAHKLCTAAVANDHSDMVIFPEMMAFLGGSVEDRHASAEVIPGGEAYEALRGMAKTHGIHVHGGSIFERAAGEDRVYNTTVVFDREGKQTALYRKIHMFDVSTQDGTVYRESDAVAPGDELVTYEADGIVFGCSICYDVRFGELYRALAGSGAQVLVVPAAFTLNTGKDHWEVLLRARAIENGCFVAAAAQWGSFPTPDGRRYNWGHSMIIDPWGHLLAQAYDRVGYATAGIDLDYLEKVRSNIPIQRHRVLKG